MAYKLFSSCVWVLRNDCNIVTIKNQLGAEGKDRLVRNLILTRLNFILIIIYSKNRIKYCESKSDINNSYIFLK